METFGQIAKKNIVLKEQSYTELRYVAQIQPVSETTKQLMIEGDRYLGA